MNMDSYLAPEPKNMENFGGLQYIIDRLPPDEHLVVTLYFIHETPKTEIALRTGLSIETVNRILRNLRRVDLTNDEPTINFKGKKLALRGLDGRHYR